MTKYFLYARKSSEVEEKQALSIDAQLSEVRAFAARENLEIVAEFIEKQSAATPGRPVFNDMLARIQADEANGILAWHPDRLARNSVDGGQIIYLLDTKRISTLKFPTVRFESDPQGKFMLSIMFGQSKYYVDALSENTKRGLREKVRRGEYPSGAPLGYLNDYRTKKIIVDRERAPIIKQAFEMYARGDITFDTVREFLGKSGIVSRTGKIPMRGHVSKIFTNPFYYGHFRYTGEVYEGIHEPIISKKLFDDVQAVIGKRFRWSSKKVQVRPKVYMGLLRCGECGGGITAEIQKGHVYYRCTRKNRVLRCSQPFIREEALDLQISALLKPFALRADWADEMVLRVKEEKKQSAQAGALVAAQKREEIGKINLRLQNLLNAFLDGVIDRNDYTAEKAKLMSQKKSLEEQGAALLKSQDAWLEPFQKWVLTAKNVGLIAVSGSLQEKRVLAQQVFGSNLVLEGKKARGSALKPWSMILDLPPYGGLVRAAGFESKKHFRVDS